MTQPIAATYEHGVLRPDQPIELPEGSRVELVILTQPAAASPHAVSRILSEIAAQPVTGNGDLHTARDHDRVLYSVRPQP